MRKKDPLDPDAEQPPEEEQDRKMQQELKALIQQNELQVGAFRKLLARLKERKSGPNTPDLP